jgi:hypothetical protein
MDTMELGHMFHQAHRFTHTNYCSANVPHPFTIRDFVIDLVHVARSRDPVSFYSENNDIKLFRIKPWILSNNNVKMLFFK